MPSIETELTTVARAMSGSFKTRADRIAEAGRFGAYLAGQGLSGAKLDHCKQEWVRDYWRSLVEAGLSKRTIQTRAGTLRGLLRESGHPKLAEASTNKDLGIDGASRDGTKTAMSDETFGRVIATLEERGHHDVAIALRLERYLGLRGKEAVLCGKSLAGWKRALEAGASIHVVHGTKGGRERYSRPVDRGAALAAVREALMVARRNHGHLIGGGRDLKQALSHYSNMCHNAGATGKEAPHSLRYAYTHALVTQDTAAGDEESEAFAAAAINLGHGDGRGRWVRQVYLR